MGIDRLFVDRLSKLERTPSPMVWAQIMQQLQKDEPSKAFYWNSAEKRAMYFIAISSLIGSLILYSFIEPLKEESNNTTYLSVQYSTPEIKRTLGAENSILKANHKSKAELKTKEYPKLVHNQSTDKSKQNQHNRYYLSNSEREYILLKEQELKLERSIAHIDNRLNQIREIEWSEVKILSCALPKTSLVNANTMTIGTKMGDINNLSHDDPKFKLTSLAESISESRGSDKSENKISPISTTNDRHFFLTPYIGTNFTQVTYQGYPNSPYFSDKTIFTGKMGYNFGIQLGYQLSKKWGVESGIGYGQYIQSFKETNSSKDRRGVMYINSLDLPLYIRYGFSLSQGDFPKTLAIKTGLIYNSVTQYQVNYVDKDFRTNQQEIHNLEVDKRKYNSLQLGYSLGFDLDAFISKKVSLNLSMMNSVVSQLENFPIFSNQKDRPIQFSTGISIGTKIKF